MSDTTESEHRYVGYAEHNLFNFIERMKEYKRKYGNRKQKEEAN